MPIDLTVVTPQGEAFSGVVDEVVLPGSEGEFGVLENHERFLAALTPGVMEIRTAEGPLWGAVSSGFAQVDGSKVVVLVDSHLHPHEIEIGAVREAHAELESQLAGLAPGDEAEAQRAELEEALTRAAAQIAVHDKVRQ